MSGAAAAGRLSAADTGERDEAFPLPVGAIDIGSNAIRFAAAEFSSPTAYRVLREQRLPVRLGHDVFVSGRLTDEAMEAGVAGLSTFREHLDELGIGRYRAVATSAVREAANGEEFVRRAREAADIEVEVITGAEEARLVHVAVASRIPLVGGRWVLVDLGGGSVEVSLVDEAGIHLSESHTMGSVRLLEELSVAGAEPGRFRQLLEEYAATLRFPYVLGGQRPRGLIATGGNAEALAKLGGAGRDGDRVLTLPLATLRTLIDTLARMSYRQRVEELGLREDRADVVLPAAMVYERIGVLSQMEEILVPQVGVRDGLLIDLVDELSSHRRHAERLDRQARAGTLVAGRRYLFDEAHGVHVAALATELYDQLRPLHGLGDEELRVLHAAAVLHDIGIHVNHKRHHRHTQYLIANSELPGFTPREIAMIASVARYHRKGEPAAHHAEFMAFDDADRGTVERLAALLRIAAALDKEHRQRVERLRVRRTGDVVRLELRGSGELLLERWALERNKAMFERVFGVTLEVQDGASRAD
jgi:exopolyphosphatase / guanosine-5'-triphosphate,3'-diphosphate pyrophosphatase